MKLNLSEIFDTAIQIEKSGYQFYTDAAKKLPEHKDFLTFLANEEVGHEAVFSDFKNKAISKEFIDNIWNPDNIIDQYINSLAGSAVFNKSSNKFDELFKDGNTIEDVIDWAIKREQDSVLFFTGLRETLKNSEEKDKIEEIISEEIRHIHLLMDKKSKLIQFLI